MYVMSEQMETASGWPSVGSRYLLATLDKCFLFVVDDS